MRHNTKGRKLGRPTSQRKGLFSNLVCSLIEHEQIETTIAKAKDTRFFAERMITYAKRGTLTSRRLAAAFLRSDEAVKKLFDVLGPRYAARAGGYTRVLKSGMRYGDAAPMGIIELVDRDVAAKGVRQKKDVEAKKAAANPDSAAEKKAADKPAKEKITSTKKDSGGKAKSQTTVAASATRKVIGV